MRLTAALILTLTSAAALSEEPQSYGFVADSVENRFYRPSPTGDGTTEQFYFRTQGTRSEYGVVAKDASDDRAFQTLSNMQKALANDTHPNPGEVLTTVR